MERVIIMGAAGRDFHNFNVYFRGNLRYQVVAFTGAQIPAIDDRLYPPELAGDLYPEGIPIHPERELPELIQKYSVDLVAFSYSDVPYAEVMHKASLAMAKGADFIFIGATYTMLRSRKPVIAVCAVRTGCGKSQTTRKVAQILRELGRSVVVVRHPMPYGDLSAQVVQRFATYEDFESHRCTIEEREEYEPLVDQGMVVYAGVDYGRILAAAEQEADLIVWDGGNNDTPFYYPDVHLVLVDPHRPGHERLYFPGETNLLMADVVIINKVDTAPPGNVALLRSSICQHAPQAEILMAESPVVVSNPERIKGKRVLVVEDGPTLTHGGMAFGAGKIAAETYGASHLVDPRASAVGAIAQAYREYPHIGAVLPAMGYSEHQIRDLEQTINAADCDVVMFATPIQLTRLVAINKPAIRVRYEYRDHGEPTLKEVLMRRLETLKEAGKIQF
jgi:predicted GTPase